MTSLDLNADLGEGVSGDAGVDPAELDDLLLREITSANVACGGHAGDDVTMARVCRLAVERSVAIGAQVSYVDRAGFGRTRLDVDGGTLTRQLLDQVDALRAHAQEAGGRVAYLKPHGALYNAAVIDTDVAGAVVDTLLADVLGTGTAMPVLTMSGGVLAAMAASRGIPVVTEAFADRAYTSDARLVPRSHHGAVIDDENTVVARVLRLATSGLVTSVDGVDLAVDARSVCLHSDTPGAAGSAARIRAALEAAGIRVRPFVDVP
jgi:UPF0271 protein